MTHHIYTRVQAKARARELKARSETGLTYASALEQVAHEMGFRDWNTAAARLSNEPEHVLGSDHSGSRIGAEVSCGAAHQVATTADDGDFDSEAVHGCDLLGNSSDGIG